MLKYSIKAHGIEHIGMKPTVREGTPDDIPRLLEIAGESPTAAHWAETEYQHLFAPKVVQEDCVLVAEMGGTSGGFLVARGVGGDWEIENIVVSAHLRRQGVGTELLKSFLARVAKSEASESFSAQSAAKTVHLEVRESNLAARELYTRLGFVPAGRRKGYYSDPPEDAILLKFSF
jgi:[ribosomal protein S18]-alanine N-acetyltransferase